MQRHKRPCFLASSNYSLVLGAIPETEKLLSPLIALKDCDPGVDPTPAKHGCRKNLIPNLSLMGNLEVSGVCIELKILPVLVDDMYVAPYENRRTGKGAA